MARDPFAVVRLPPKHAPTLDANEGVVVGAKRALLDQAAELTRLAAGEPYLWVDGLPRAMAATARPTHHTVSINAVYTPPAERGRGYATGCVALLSERMLAAGRRACVLFTDLANPTSNAVYARIGYQPVADFVLVELDGAEG